MLRTLRAVFAGIVLLVAGPVLANVVCRAPGGIAGFSNESDRAYEVLNQRQTRNLNECEVYLTLGRDGYLYAHSNFVTAGYDVATKIAIRGERDLQVLLLNMVYAPPEGQGISLAQERAVDAAHRNTVRYYIDQSLLDTSGEIRLDLGGAENLYMVYPGSPTPRRLYRSNAIRGPPYVAEWTPSVFVNVTPTLLPERFFNSLAARPFDRQNVRVVSLFQDSAVTEALQTINSQTVALERLSADELSRVFQSNAGRVVVLLGHVEENRFVTRDASGQNVLIDIPLADVEAMATANRCDVMFLGCQSSSANPSVGVKQEFSPLTAISRLRAAFDASNYQQFVERLSSDEINLVFSEAAFSETRRHADADVYASSPGAKAKFSGGTKVGRVVWAFAPPANAGNGQINVVNPQTKPNEGTSPQNQQPTVPGASTAKNSPTPPPGPDRSWSSGWIIWPAILVGLFFVFILMNRNK